MSPPPSTVDRPLALRLRADVVAVPVEMSGATTWIVKDPVTLEHFQFSAEEYALVDALRRPVNIAELQREYEHQFAPRRISPQAVWDFLSRLHAAGLLISDGPGQGAALLNRRRRDRIRNWAMSWTRLLAIRFRGLDPDAFLTAVHDRLGWLFSRAALAPLLAAVLYALWLVVGHFDVFYARLPELAALFDMRNLPWLLVAIGAVKVLHELGHAMMCKRYGGEVRELGFMLLAFAPCLYCDVSDAWRLPNKWRRIAVSAAGIVVELALAALAAIVWWHAQPGVVQLVAMNVMIVCTVNTLLVNGNPLLRFDGYYILADLLETPNLWQRSREVLRRLASRWMFSTGAAAGDDDPLIPSGRRTWLALYAVASKIYITIVVVAIVWGLAAFLYPYHLQNLAYAVGLTVLAGAMFGPASGAVRLARNPVRRGELRTGRLAVVTALGAAVIVGVLSMPVNYYVKAPVVLMPDDAARVFATLEGTLAEVLPVGSVVKRGEIIGTLTNNETQRELFRVEGQHRLRQLRVEHLERLRGTDREANDALPTARAALADSQRRLEELRREARRLTLIAPIDGVIIAPPRLPRHPTPDTRHPQARLATWSGSLLDASNCGAHVEPGTLVCLIGDLERLTAVLLVDDTDVKRLQPGQRARLRFDQLPGEVLEGEVIDVARHDVRDAESASAARADLATLFRGMIPPGKTAAFYQARVRFERSASQSLVIGGRGQAKVAAERITLALRIVRFFAQTFRLPV